MSTWLPVCRLSCSNVITTYSEKKKKTRKQIKIKKHIWWLSFCRFFFLLLSLHYYFIFFYYFSVNRDPSIQSRLQLDWHIKNLTICKKQKKKMGWLKTQACSTGGHKRTEKCKMADAAETLCILQRECFQILLHFTFRPLCVFIGMLYDTATQ